MTNDRECVPSAHLDRTTESRIAAAPPEDARAWLLVLRDGAAWTHALPDDGVVILGRGEGCDLRVVDDPLLSRRHAQLRVGPQHVTIVDLGSANGTRVGERVIAPREACALSPGDVVAVGSTYLVLQTAEARTGVRPRASGAEHAAAPTTAEIVDGGALARLEPLLARFAAGAIPVLVLGETGVGKDVVSRELHRLSPRASRPMVCLNCAALPETLLESELFGHERGAFTGAAQAKVGILESVAGGTVLLDEVAEMPLAIQAKLLRVLDHREVLRLGATRPRPIDARFLAATNRDLAAEVAAGRFRQDLYFRLAGATVVVPPLRERLGEIAPLARTFADRAARELGRATPRFTAAAMAALERHAWPGNVRELKNTIDRAVLLAQDGVIDAEEVAPDRATAARTIAPEMDPAATLRPGDLARRVRAAALDLPPSSSPSLDMARILDVLEQCGGNQTQAAKRLGISRRTIVARLSAYGLTRRRRAD